MALIKPQFEAGREAVAKGGVVRDPAVHAQVCGRVRSWLDGLPGWHVLGLTDSPILGPEGGNRGIPDRCEADHPGDGWATAMPEVEVAGDGLRTP